MTTFKMPEPVLIGMEEAKFNEFKAVYGYTEAQLKQALKDVLEQAAQVCDRNAQSTSADEIRKMIGEIK